MELFQFVYGFVIANLIWISAFLFVALLAALVSYLFRSSDKVDKPVPKIQKEQEQQ